MLRCQAQLELTLMMCFGDRSTSTGAFSDHSTFTSIDATDLRHCFFWRTCCCLGAYVFARAQALSPPIFSKSCGMKRLANHILLEQKI
jgi:hypothetical protein